MARPTVAPMPVVTPYRRRLYQAAFVIAQDRRIRAAAAPVPLVTAERVHMYEAAVIAVERCRLLLQ